jgi:predicted ABC-type ATPase
LATTGRFSFSSWGVVADLDELREFCRAHPMGGQLAIDDLQIVGDDLALAAAGPTGYLAAVLSDFLRRKWVASGQSFTYETVMSSADKVDLLEHARRGGYRTYTYFVCTDNPSINVGRVAYRVTQGGHDVPGDKIVSRYGRSLGLLPRAVAASDRAYLFDNSERNHRLVAEYDGGNLVAAASLLPNWFIRTMLHARPLP